MRVWLDDTRPIFFDTGENGIPNYDIHVVDADTCIKLIDTGIVTFISFDHDLGPKKTGNDVAKHILARALDGYEPPAFKVHSSNTVGAQNIINTMNDAFEQYQIWAEGCSKGG